MEHMKREINVYVAACVVTFGVWALFTAKSVVDLVCAIRRQRHRCNVPNVLWLTLCVVGIALTVATLWDAICHAACHFCSADFLPMISPTWPSHMRMFSQWLWLWPTIVTFVFVEDMHGAVRRPLAAVWLGLFFSPAVPIAYASLREPSAEKYAERRAAFSVLLVTGLLLYAVGVTVGFLVPSTIVLGFPFWLLLALVVPLFLLFPLGLAQAYPRAYFQPSQRAVPWVAVIYAALGAAAASNFLFSCRAISTPYEVLWISSIKSFSEVNVWMVWVGMAYVGCCIRMVWTVQEVGRKALWLSSVTLLGPSALLPVILCVGEMERFTRSVNRKAMAWETIVEKARNTELQHCGQRGWKDRGTSRT